MLQLLIVDDETESLEWLREMFEEEQSEEIDIYTAVSGKKAIEVLNRVKCDVVLTDIKMPGMDGVELYRHVKENWPMARIVFLTGYSSHDILYQISQDKEVRYLIKTEPPRKIVDTVLEVWRENRKKQDRLLEEKRKDALIDRAQYWLEKEQIQRILSDGSARSCDRTGFPLNLDCPALIFTGRSAGEKKKLSYEQQETILFALRENMPGIVKAAAYIMDANYVLGIVQPKLLGEQADWKRALHVSQGALENVQGILSRSVRLNIPFAIYEEPVLPEMLGQIYYLLKEKLIAMPEEPEPGIRLVRKEAPLLRRIDNRSGLLRLPMLDHCLEQGNFPECAALLKEMTVPLLGASSMHDGTALELYYNISMVYLKYINARGWGEKLPFYIGLYPLTRVEDFVNWGEAVDYLLRLTDALADYLEASHPGNQAMERVEQYIRGHLDEDLGLSVLADVGGFNASYLSRIFKQKYHCNLSEYITRERIGLARRLLAETDEKIYRIAERTGYQTVTSFNRVFKKAEGISPAEYRTRFQQVKN